MEVPGDAGCGGFYGDHSGNLIGSFLMNIGVGNTFTEELTTAMMDIEIAKDKNWNHLWLESDSKLVVLAFKKNYMVPWSLRNKWENILHHTRFIHLFGNSYL